MAETLKQVPGFEEIPKKQFESKRVGLLSKLGTFKAAAQLCGNSYATQYVDRFETEPVGASDSGDLFGDGGNPQIALVGTSNSGRPTTSPASEEFSGADILNNAVSGGGFDSSLLAYMTSEEFHKNPPKILIWEFATHYDMAQKSLPPGHAAGGQRLLRPEDRTQPQGQAAPGPQRGAAEQRRATDP